MTGEEFLNKVRSIKQITDIHWSVEGDVLEPDEVTVVIVADGEEIKVDYPRPGKNEDADFIQMIGISLIINKFMEQISDVYRTGYEKDIVEAINYSIKNLKSKGGK